MLGKSIYVVEGRKGQDAPIYRCMLDTEHEAKIFLDKAAAKKSDLSWSLYIYPLDTHSDDAMRSVRD